MTVFFTKYCRSVVSSSLPHVSFPCFIRRLSFTLRVQILAPITTTVILCSLFVIWAIYIGEFILKIFGLIIFEKKVLGPGLGQGRCNLTMGDYSWLCSHVINPGRIWMRRSSLLLGLWPPAVERKSENIWGNKYYVKGSYGRTSASRSENWAWNIYILRGPASRASKRMHLRQEQFRGMMTVVNVFIFCIKWVRRWPRS